ncbi:DUF4349 domain-containing protein [Bacillaceae bacterium IKA-2]|nr:DUF4349 domain-containing protein [Bacillaceae bacterium IKA-2]
MFGCSSSDNSDQGFRNSNEKAEDAATESEMDYDGTDSGESTQIARDLEKNFNDTDRMIIYHANLSIEVNDYHKVETQILEKVSTLGGYIVESTIYASGKERINGNLVVKVPQASFHSFINDVELTSMKVYDRHVSSNDVTEEFIDLDSRLKSKRVVEERLLGFLEQAKQTEDLLKISNDLARVQEETEQLLGRMNYLKNNIAYSTVSLQLSEKLVNVQFMQDKEALNTWLKSKSLFMDSLNGVISFFASVIVFFIGRSPILLPIAVFGIIAIIFIRKQYKNPSQE